MQEGRRKLLDLLIEWGMQRPAQLEQDAYSLQRTAQALDARFKVCNLGKKVPNVHNRENIGDNQHKSTIIMCALVVTSIVVNFSITVLTIITMAIILMLCDSC